MTTDTQTETLTDTIISRVVPLWGATKNCRRKDGKMRRYRKCASCKYRCGQCQPCTTGSKKAKAGCRNRYICMMSTGLVDEPNLFLDGKHKRMRKEERDEDYSSSKGLKLSDSAEKKASVVITESESVTMQ